VKPASLTGTRWAIEARSGTASSCEGHIWQGWHHHMTLCLLLHFFMLRGKLASKCSPRMPLRELNFKRLDRNVNVAAKQLSRE